MDEQLREMWAGGEIPGLIYRKAVSAAVQHGLPQMAPREANTLRLVNLFLTSWIT